MYSRPIVFKEFSNASRTRKKSAHLRRKVSLSAGTDGKGHGPELGSHKDFAARNAGLANSLPNKFFIS